MKGLYVSAQYSSLTGGGLVTAYFKDVLMSLESLDITTYSFDIESSNFKKLNSMLKGHLLGMKNAIIEDILSLISKNRFDFIFINTSNFGILTQKIKQLAPNVKIITLYHNVECNYIKSAIKSEFKLHKLLTWIVTYYNELKVTQHSDYIITLNHRDSNQLKQIYGRSATDIIPICLKDRFKHDTHVDVINKCPIGLFVGSNFYANLHGVKWFVNNVAPYVEAKIVIVGKGFENNRSELEVHPNISVIGSVPSPDEYYYKADFIISPIFYGSGMKTKTAEAFMFGKSVYGTTEAFEGYEVDYSMSGALCNSAQEFIDAINSHKQSFNIYNRTKYLELYSYTSLVDKIEKLLARL